jgi:hypothetical protein
MDDLCQKNNIIHKEEPSQFQDRILRKLQDVVVDVILKEIIRGVFCLKRDSLYTFFHNFCFVFQ